MRLVLEPKSRAVDPMLLMESLFRLTELELRFSLNMNVLSAGQVPGVLSLRDVLRQWLDHRQVVLVRRSKFRLQKIEHRLEVLDGYLIAYLNIDEVITIVRFEDDPKAKLIKRFKLTEVQAEAILNLRLKSLSKLEEVEIKAEHDKLSKERRELKSLLKSDDLQWERITEEVKATREAYSKKTDARPPPQHVRRRTGHRGRSRTGDDREGAHHRDPVREGLDPRHEGPHRRLLQARVQAGRPAAARRQGADDRQAAGARHQRQGVHAAGRPASRAGAATASRCG